MKLITCIIIDDEPLAREGMALNIKEVAWLQLKGEFANAIKASAFLNEQSIDLIFLDIEMPGLNGLEFLKGLKFDGITILTTAYPQFALEAFELEVLDYLIKPIRFTRFFKAVNRAKEIVELHKKEKIEIENVTDDFFYIRSDRKYVKLQFDEVLWIKGLKDYVMIHTENKKYMVAFNIKTIYTRLPKEIFARVSKSYIINTGAIETIDVDTITIDKEIISLGATYKDDFLEKHIKGRLFKR